MSDIEPLHRFAYQEGVDPIEHAVFLVRITIEVRDMIRAARVHKPNAYPIFKISLSDEATARRAIGVLLDAGWKPPVIDGRAAAFTSEHVAIRRYTGTGWPP